MTLEANVLPTRRRQGDFILVVCEYLHLESEMSRRVSFQFPIGLDPQPACTALIPVVEDLFEDTERNLWNRRVRDRGQLRGDVQGVILNTNQLLKYVLEQAYAAPGTEAVKYNDFVQEFLDSEISQALSITEQEAATWKQNSQANADAFDFVRNYTPLVLGR